MIYLVNYDLKVPGRDYTKLYETLKATHGWWHYLESTWILHTTEPLVNVRQRIQAVLDTNDRFIIVDITGKARDGWLPKDAWEWIDQRQ